MKVRSSYLLPGGWWFVKIVRLTVTVSERWCRSVYISSLRAHSLLTITRDTTSHLFYLLTEYFSLSPEYLVVQSPSVTVRSGLTNPTELNNKTTGASRGHWTRIRKTKGLKVHKASLKVIFSFLIPLLSFCKIILSRQ